MLHSGRNIRRQINAYKQRLDRSNYIKNLKATLQLCLFVFLCLVTISQMLVPSEAFAAQLESPKSAPQTSGGYLLDEVITWADGSKEHVQIGKDGFFTMDGVKRKLVGMYLSTCDEQLTHFWLPEHLAFLDKELTYLESIGIRLIRMELPYVQNRLCDIAAEEAAGTALMDLVYKHKMLVIAGIYPKYWGGFNDFTNADFSWNLCSSWSRDCKPTFLYPEPGRSGSSCVGIKMVETEPFDLRREAMWLKQVSIEAGKAYSVEGWIRTENIVGPGGAMIVTHWEGPGEKWIGSSEFMSYVRGTKGWTYYQGIVIAPPGATIGKISCLVAGCSGTAWFDDMVFGGKLVLCTDSLSAAAKRWAAVVGRYQNVIAINVDNELDYKLKAKDLWWLANPKNQEYTAEEIAGRIAILRDILRKIGVPLIQNLMVNQTEPEIKRVCLSVTAIPAFDCYGTTTATLSAEIAGFLSWSGTTTGWWAAELNHLSTTGESGNYDWNIDVSKFDVSFIDTVFNHGATIAILFGSSDPRRPGWAFFDGNGNPVPKLVEIARDFPRLQTPITEMLAIKNSTGAFNITATIARLNDEVTSTGNESATVHIYWGIADGGTTPDNWAHDVNLGKPAGVFSTDVPGLKANNTYCYRSFAQNSAGSS